MQSHPAWRGKPIARDSSSDRPHPPRRDENVLAASSQADGASSGTVCKRPVPFPRCILWQEYGAIRLASQQRLRVPTWSCPFPMALQTARRLDTDSLLTWRRFAWVYPIQQTQRCALVDTSRTMVAGKPSRFALASPFPIARCDEAIRVESRVSRCQCLSKAMAEDTKANHLRFWTSLKIRAKIE